MKIPALKFLQNGKIPDLIIITLIWGLAVWLINPAGNFPLNDDWSYGIAVKNLLEDGSYSPTPWTSMTLISQALWGALFCLLFGFSFEILRFSTLALALLGTFSLYLLIRELKQTRWLAVLTALAVAFSPIYLQLSHTFMTDVPFTAFATMSLLFLVRNLKSASATDLIIGSFLAMVAVLCRQTALFIPLAFGLTVVYKYGLHKRSLATALFPNILVFGSLIVFQYWLKATGKTPELYGQQVGELIWFIRHPEYWIPLISSNITVTVLYLGFFLSPVLLLLFLSSAETEQAAWAKKWATRGIIPLSVLMGAGLAYMDLLMPVGYNLIHKAGLGPFSLFDVYKLELPNLLHLPEKFWIGITMLAVLGGAVLLIYLLAALRFAALNVFRKSPDPKPYLPVFFLLCAAIYFLPLLLVKYYYDRYLLMLMVLTVLMLLSFTGRVYLRNAELRVTGTVVAALFAIFSIALTHDYLSWNRARWKALEHITVNKNVPYAQIHGGFEFNGLNYFSNKTEGKIEDGNWWSEDAKDYQYMVTFGEVPGFEVVETYGYTRWIPPFHDEILLIRRKPASASIGQ